VIAVTNASECSHLQIPTNTSLLGIKWYNQAWNDAVRWTTKQPHLSTVVQARRFSLFGNIVQMPHKTDAKILTAFSLENWRMPSYYMDEDYISKT